MTEAPATAATLGGYSDWRQIDWGRAQRTVERLQTRIVKAVNAGNWRKVKALQRLLTRSFSAKAMAVRKITENRGKRTPGIDGQTWRTPEAKFQGIRSLNPRGYRPQPLRRIYIPKANGKKRPLGIPTMADRAMQSLWLLALDPVQETTADPHSYGFRKCRSTADAAGHLFSCLARKDRARWILDADIQGCFDNISHDWMLNHIPMNRTILKKWLKAGYVEEGKLFPTEAGTPQGGSLSPTLANMVLNGLEHYVREQLQQELGKTRAEREAKVNLIRYADDFACTAATPAICETASRHVQAFLSERGLRLSAEKTKIVNIRDGCDFLGWQIRKYGSPKKREVLLIKPAKSSQKRHAQKLRDTIKRFRAVNQVDLINALNPLIRGWCHYHAPMVSKAVFEKMDNVLWLALWPWANRRHPNKGRRWVACRYFHTIGNRRWAFAAKRTDAQGQEQWIKLHYHAPTPIKRHVPIKAQANPYDPTWEEYFQRRERQLARAIPSFQTRKLWDRQQGRCRCCGQPLLIDEEWHSHHVIPKALGGSDKLDNLWLVHSTCHHQYHANHDFGTAGSP